MNDVFRLDSDRSAYAFPLPDERLHSFVENLLHTRGLDPKPVNRLRDIGLDDKACCSFEIDVDGDAVCLLVIPRRFSRDAMTADHVRRYGRKAEALGLRFLAVPETLLRASAASGRDAGAATAVKADDRLRVLDHFLRHGSAGLFELAARLEHENPVAAILELDVDGALSIDDGILSSRSRVTLAGNGVRP
ncbi:hypothetical protein SAMN06295905_1603 [Devosia lucknowensis]|uniref:Uncharacterized protein n=1 Tax=Devosia lucknowensis TaxID=1096929 RepID=A0A1Y6F1A2_9HYPH|nr:hypothetical protein [Devosia lucknowensis]SMQ68614.1 hypothetical protein SAMN06295905_1603 [Devosia lucknowensis]